MYRYAGMDGLKTGFTSASGFNLAASAVRGDHRLFAVVMGGRSGFARDNLMATLLDNGFAHGPTDPRAAAGRRGRRTERPRRAPIPGRRCRRSAAPKPPRSKRGRHAPNGQSSGAAASSRPCRWRAGPSRSAPMAGPARPSTATREALHLASLHGKQAEIIQPEPGRESVSRPPRQLQQRKAGTRRLRGAEEIRPCLHARGAGQIRCEACGGPLDLEIATPKALGVDAERSPKAPPPLAGGG